MARAPVIWFAEEGSVTVNGQLYSNRVTDIEVRGGVREAEQIVTFGANALLAQRPQAVMETSITSIVSGIELAALVWGAGSTNAKGRLISGMGTRTAVNVVYTWTDPTDTTNGPALRFRFASGFGTESTLTLGTDNQLTETFVFKTLPQNSFREFVSGGGAAALTSPAL
jgi:hypothetical protein